MFGRVKVDHLCWCVQCVDVFTPNVVELDDGVPGGGRT